MPCTTPPRFRKTLLAIAASAALAPYSAWALDLAQEPPLPKLKLDAPLRGTKPFVFNRQRVLAGRQQRKVELSRFVRDGSLGTADQCLAADDHHRTLHRDIGPRLHDGAAQPGGLFSHRVRLRLSTEPGE